MRNVRVALAQIGPRLGDLDANLDMHRGMIERATAEGAGLVVFPELSLTGYLLRDQVPEVAIRPGHPVFTALEEASRSIDLIVGFAEEAPGHRFHNAAAYFSGGRLVHLHRKLFLPTYGLFQEGRDFAAGERLRSFETPHGQAGLLVCEDLWHQTCSWLLAQDGAEVIFGISNGPTRGARPGHEITSVAVWRQLLHVTAQFLTSYIVYVNRIGFEDGLGFGGGSMVVDPFGHEVASLPPLDEGLVTVELEDEVLRRARTAYPLLRDADLELVRRELDRIRHERYALPGDAEDTAEDDASSEAPAAASDSRT